jgi:TonB family protein
MTAISFRRSTLPWALDSADEKRFRELWLLLLAISLGIGIGSALLPRPVEDRSAPAELAPRIAKLILEHETPPPPPPPPVVKPDPNQPVQTGSEEPEKQKVQKAKVPLPEARQPKPDKAPGDDLANARRKATGVGLLADSNLLKEIHSAPTAVQLNPDIKPGAGVGTGVGVGVGAGTDPGLPARSLITSNATGGSGGINTAGYSHATGGGGLAGRGTTLVEGVAGGGGGGGFGTKGSTAAPQAVGGGNKGGTLSKGNSGKASRTVEDLRLVFERNKGAIYAIYNRALREDPGLQGKVVFRLVIAPNGSVTDCSIVSSELKNPGLEQKLVARIRQFDFGAKDVDVMNTTYPFDFLPG